MKIIQWSILGALLLLLCIGESGLAKEIRLESNQPGLNVQLKLNGGNYEQEVQIELAQPVSTQKVRGLVRDGSLTVQMNEWVKKAEFTKVDQMGRSNYTLAIGKSFFVYTHKFRCKESLGETWLQHCAQQPVGEDLVVRNGINTVECGAVATGVASGTMQTTHCLFRMKGSTSDIKVPFAGKIEAGFIASKLFVENVSYIAHLGLILSGIVSDAVQAKRLFAGSPYATLVAGLDQKIEAQRAQTEIVQIQSELGFGYAFRGAEQIQSDVATR